MPVLKDPTPLWMKPGQESVLDSPMQKVMRILASVLGANDATGQVMGVASPLAMAALPMDEAARAARAVEQGFSRDVFHGTTRSFPSFDPSAKSRWLNDKGWFGKPAVYTTPSADSAAEYAFGAGDRLRRGANVIPLKARLTNPLVIDMVSDAEGTAKRLAAVGVDYTIPKTAAESKRYAAKVKAAGYDGVVVKTLDPDTGAVIDHEIVVYEPKNLRSRFAAFDPSRSDSADLLASITAMAAAKKASEDK